MSQDNMRIIKKRASSIQKVIKVILFIGVLLLFAALIIAVVLFFSASPERFKAVKGNLDWLMTYELGNDSSFDIYIPFKIIQPLDSNMFNAKYAFLTYLISRTLTNSIILYGISQIANILNSIAKDITPFIMGNVKSLKRLAYSIIIYSVVVDILSTLLCSVFVTKMFYLDLSTIHLSGVLMGVLIFIIADIFKYGVFLQNESDTTL